MKARSDRNSASRTRRLLYSLVETMIWFFDKGGEKLRYEITRDRAGGPYRVVITYPDGRQSVEEVDEPIELIERSIQLMNSLSGDGWRVA
jgi:hypothetical protein